MSTSDLVGSTSSRRSWTASSFRDATDVFRRPSVDRAEDEEDLKWAAIEKLPTYDRMRKGILRKEAEDGKIVSDEVDIEKLGISERKVLVEHILRVVEEDNERFLRRLKSRIDQFGAF